jgi:hypothetical protein
MQTHSKLFNSLNRIEQRAHHELYLSRRGFPISEQTSEFLVQNPSFIHEEFGTLFETEQFKLGDNNPFYCPIARTSGIPNFPPHTPPYQSDSLDSDCESNIFDTTNMGKDSNKKAKKDKSHPSALPAEQDDDSINYHNKDETPPDDINLSSRNDFKSSEQDDNNFLHDDDYQKEDGEINVRYGFNGKPLIKFDRGQPIFVSN